MAERRIALVPLYEKLLGKKIVNATKTQPARVAIIKRIPAILLKLHFVPYHWLNARRVDVLKSIVSPTPADLTVSDSSALRKPVHAKAMMVGISIIAISIAATVKLMQLLGVLRYLSVLANPYTRSNFKNLSMTKTKIQ